MKMDFSGFKKAREDKDSATFVHPDGHTIRIVKNKLKDDHKKEMDDLPKKMANGGETNSSSVNDIEDSASPVTSDSTSPANSNSNSFGQIMRQAFLDGNPVFNAALAAKNSLPSAQTIQDFTAGLSGQPANASVSPLTPSQVPPTSYTGPAMPSWNQAQTQGTGSLPSAGQNGFGELMKGVNEQKQGLGLEAQAQSSQGKNQAAQSLQQIQTLRDAQDQYNSHLGNLNAQVQSAVDDVKNGHINPNHYMENLSVPGKISTAIGLIAGGIGGALTHQENPAMAFLNNQINRDVESQRQNLGQKTTVLDGYLHQYGNLNQAMAMTTATQGAIYSAQLQNAAAQATDPMAKARLLQATGHFDQTVVAPALEKQAMMHMLNQGGQGSSPGSMPNPARQIMLYEQLGVAPKDTTQGAMKELGSIQGNSKLQSDLQDAFNDVHSKFMNGLLSPNDTASAKNVFADILQHDTAGRFNMDAAKQQAEAIIPGKTDFPATVQNKQKRLNQLFQTLEIKHPNMDALGIKVPPSVTFTQKKTL